MLGYGAVCFDFHLAVVGEFDSVGEQVEEDLAQPVWVANHVRLCRWAQEAADLKPLAKCLACDRVDGFFHNLRQSRITLQLRGVEEFTVSLATDLGCFCAAPSISQVFTGLGQLCARAVFRIACKTL